MPLTPTNRFMNWTVTITPPGGSATVIDGVLEVDFPNKGKAIPFYGDLGVFAQAVAIKEKERPCRIKTGNPKAAAALTGDGPFTIAATLADHRNGVATGGGAQLYTLSNAILVGDPLNGPLNQFASSELSFMAYSTDGVTDPLVITAV